MTQDVQLVWLRNDLRVRDNPALFQACSTGKPVVAVAALTPGQWQKQDEGAPRVQFWYGCLQALAGDLAALNIPLRILRAPTNRELPVQIESLCTQLCVSCLYFNNEIPAYEQMRDAQVEARVRAKGISVARFDADTVLAPGAVRTGQGTAFKVFTPFSKAWRRVYAIQRPQVLGLPQPCRAAITHSDPLPESLSYSSAFGVTWQSTLWPAGSDVAHTRLQQFVQNAVNAYPEQRDFPAQVSTSTLSPWLTVGALSVRQCLAAMEAYSTDPEWFDNQWVTELIWREFYRHLLVDFPEMNRLEPFRPEVEQRLQWSDDAFLWKAWCDGETGFPLVDAGMKQLRETGWMHNRVRMVTSAFLTKLMRQDWRKGAAFFMQHLVDADFASNMGGWQWSASVGADAAPYFRIFNPARQAERFDAQGGYIAHWLPELKDLPPAKRLDPKFTQQYGRPAPVIDYSASRKQSLDAYNNAG